jgi:UDP-N-acetylglucosamine enolpyruvyl transferase
MLTRDKKAYIPISYGWCTDMQSQKRACNFHLECFEKMGANIDIWSKENGDELVNIVGTSMEGTNYTFPKVSVTGTVNTVLAAIGCEGETILNNVALEPEVIFALNLFMEWGFNIKLNKENRQIIIQGIKNFSPIKLEKRMVLELPSDRLLAGSFMILALMKKSHLELEGNNIVVNNQTLIETLQNIGGQITIINNNKIKIHHDPKVHGLKPLMVEANPFPGIATDLFPFILVLSVFCQGTSHLKDNVYNTRALSISLFLQKFDVNIDIISGCEVFVNHKEQIPLIHNNDYQKWLNNIQNIRGQTAAFFFLIISQEDFVIDFNTFGNQIVRGYPYNYFMEDLKTIGLKAIPLTVV